MNHPLRNFQRGPTWSSNNDPLVASNRIMDDCQFLPGIGMKSIVDRDSGTIGILECCSTTIDKRRERATQCRHSNSRTPMPEELSTTDASSLCGSCECPCPNKR